jgi:predicted TIM-barrel fold metal-dependent hydrolase
VADNQPASVLQAFAARIRQVGPERVLYGTDVAPTSVRHSWETFATTVGLTEREVGAIARNVAPYLR